MASDIVEQVSDFFSQYPLKTFDKNELLVRAEESPAGVFYIVEGRVSQYDIATNGDEVVVNIFKPGAFFPMSWAINDTPNHYFFEASTKVVVRQAPAADVVQLLKDKPAVLFDLLGRVYRGVDGVLRRMAHLMAGGAKSRLLFEMLNAAYRFGELQPDGSTFIALKESDLARSSGLARETVNRTMQSLKQEGIVLIEHRGITIHDIGQLERLLGREL